MNAGDRARVTHADVTSEGVLIPSSTEDHPVVELDGGYNVGIVREEADVGVLETDVYDIEDAQSEGDGTSGIEFDDDLPIIPLISTGGTIASTVDYRTGAVTAQLDTKDVLRAVPGLVRRAGYRGRVVANILSESMTTDMWVDLAETVAEEVEGGADNIVAMHGTDTMQFSASTASFMLDTPVPIVFVGSQCSADRPPSDNVMNAVCAVEATRAETAEVMVCIHVSESGDICTLHEGTRVRKNHTSRRDTFETVGTKPLGEVDYEAEEVMFHRGYTPRCEADLALHASIGSGMELTKFTLGAGPAALGYLNKEADVVIEGAGLGHVRTDLIPRFEELVEGGTVVTVTSQCLEGRVYDRVYDTGRDLLDTGVVEAGDALPGVTEVKLMWVLTNIADPTDAMGRNPEGGLTQHLVLWE